jgi:hypothetical protein
VIHTDSGLSDTVSFNWGETGTKMVTVTASNMESTAVHTHVITLGISPLTGLIVSGPQTGFAHVPSSFTAVAEPITATQPITYIWQATDKSPQLREGRGLSDTFAATWSLTGTKTVTVTAINVGGTVTVSHVITIFGPIPPESVAITGPTEGIVQFGHTFTATASPISTTVPITYHWRATGQADVIASTSTPSHTTLFTWDTPGTKAITVSATNVGGTITDTHLITVDVSLINVNINGPSVGIIDTFYTFTAAVSPTTASEPIAYSWSPEPATGQSTAIVEYVWSITGPHTISVIVRNIDGIATDTHVINLGQYVVFLPTVVRD